MAQKPIRQAIKLSALHPNYNLKLRKLAPPTVLQPHNVQQALPSPPTQISKTNPITSAPVTYPHPSLRDFLKIPQFSLDKSFLESYSSKQTNFGFDGLGEVVYRRTYSRLKEDNLNESWHETIARVVNGTFSLLKRHLISNNLPYNPVMSQQLAQKMFEKIFNFKFLPPGRGLWAMGSSLTEERGLFAALNNCAFVSTEKMWDKSGHPSDPFTFLMDASMLGVGVGFDTAGAKVQGISGNCYSNLITGPDKTKNPVSYQIPDSREGWVEATRLVLDSYMLPNSAPVVLDYSLVRPAGEPIRGFGGVASGPGPLRDLHVKIEETLSKNIGKQMSITTIVDLFNLIGRCVIAGNVRRTAEIAFGDPENEEYINLKNYAKNPERSEFGWTSNNSIFANFATDYSRITPLIQQNGEPGFFWLDNARQYSRMCDPVDNKDNKAKGGNPCLEQTLESYELCCLVETFPHKHESLEDYLDTLELAFLYAKIVTLGRTGWEKSNQVMMRNRRIGCSMSGITQFVEQHGVNKLKEWCEKGYEKLREVDSRASEEFGVPKSIKMTSIKPSGTVSILAGATPGMHYPEARYCIRRIRFSAHSPLLPALRSAGYPTEPAQHSTDTYVVSFPIDFGEIKSLDKVSMWEQLSLAALLQKYWADNQVSCTITFDPEREGESISRAVEYFQYQLKGVSFLPRLEKGAYAQMPFEAISESQYLKMRKKINSNVLGMALYGKEFVQENTNETTKRGQKKITVERVQGEDAVAEKWCDGGVCELETPIEGDKTQKKARAKGKGKNESLKS